MAEKKKTKTKKKKFDPKTFDYAAQARRDKANRRQWQVNMVEHENRSGDKDTSRGRWPTTGPFGSPKNMNETQKFQKAHRPRTDKQWEGARVHVGKDGRKRIVGKGRVGMRDSYEPTGRTLSGRKKK